MKGREASVVSRRMTAVGIGLAAGLLVVALASLLLLYRIEGAAAPRASSGSSYEGSELDARLAPGFRLMDQFGTSVSLADLRGKVVVLTLLDPDCTDVCPLYAHQFRLADEALGEAAAGVAFVAFNANNKKTAVDNVMAATKQWGMAEMPNWHFLTGSAEELQRVWKTYGLYASGEPKPGKRDEMQHSPAIFVLDQEGRRRWYISTTFEGAPAPSKLIVTHARALLAAES